MSTTNKSSIDQHPRPPLRVLIIEMMRLHWLPSRRARKGSQPLVGTNLGVADLWKTTQIGSTQIFSGFPEKGDGWAGCECLVAGTSDIVLPQTRHPDFVSARVPEHGELFDAEYCLLWATPNRIVRIENSFAMRFLAGRHGEVIGDLVDFLRERAFDEALDAIQRSHGRVLEGREGAEIIDCLTRLVWNADLLRAADSVIGDLAEQVDAHVDHQPNQRRISTDSNE